MSIFHLREFNSEKIWRKREHKSKVNKLRYVIRLKRWLKARKRLMNALARKSRNLYLDSNETRQMFQPTHEFLNGKLR